MNPSKGVDQSSIISLIPNASSWDVDQNVTLQAKFSVELDAKHVQKNNVKLQRLITEDERELIKGEVGFDVEENSVTFTPETILVNGYYEVAFKSLKAVKTKKEEKIKEIKYRFYVPEVTNGHKLPPEPDEAMNNATVLGVDRNGNEVRDDVERWIYTTYQESLEQAALMQGAFTYQKVIENPSDALNKIQYSNDNLACQFYLKRKFDFNYYLMSKEMRHVQFNTLGRHTAYKKYNAALHGKVLSTPAPNKEKCNFDVDSMMSESK